MSSSKETHHGLLDSILHPKSPKVSEANTNSPKETHHGLLDSILHPKSSKTGGIIHKRNVHSMEIISETKETPLNLRNSLDAIPSPLSPSSSEETLFMEVRVDIVFYGTYCLAFKFRH